ncbi:hypothetical protein BT96DRAFT_1007451 [Gymnopus androsaceus JB14]|uniref:BAH domain-containing protein n=1 Tax=Gymnopus androsaceus JB14 TaxID=1447944 RepID=A0A6A4GHP0_9AGAR|nr:hypothetical protein BT96DRAFT_1007451 [Gymnopus androsaceus JB14]
MADSTNKNPASSLPPSSPPSISSSDVDIVPPSDPMELEEFRLEKTNKKLFKTMEEPPSVLKGQASTAKAESAKIPSTSTSSTLTLKSTSKVPIKKVYQLRSGRKSTTKRFSNVGSATSLSIASIIYMDPRKLDRIWDIMGPEKAIDTLNIQFADGQSVTIGENDCVFIHNEEYAAAMKRKDLNSLLFLWFGKVHEIRRVQAGTLVRIQWFYNFQQAKALIVRGMGDQAAVKFGAGAGEYELYLSDHFQAVDADCILDKARIVTFNEGDSQQCWIEHDQWYTRGSLTVTKGGTSTRVGAMTLAFLPNLSRSCCNEIYNLEQDQQVFCSGCKCFQHIHHLEEINNFERSIPATTSLFERSAHLPIIRGLGWYDDLTELGFDEDDFLPWVSVGSQGLLNYARHRLGKNGKFKRPKVTEGYGTREEAIMAFDRCAKVVEVLGGNRSWKCLTCKGQLDSVNDDRLKKNCLCVLIFMNSPTSPNHSDSPGRTKRDELLATLAGVLSLSFESPIPLISMQSPGIQQTSNPLLDGPTSRYAQNPLFQSNNSGSNTTNSDKSSYPSSPLFIPPSVSSGNHSKNPLFHGSADNPSYSSMSLAQSPVPLFIPPLSSLGEHMDSPTSSNGSSETASLAISGENLADDTPRPKIPEDETYEESEEELFTGDYVEEEVDAVENGLWSDTDEVYRDPNNMLVILDQLNSLEPTVWIEYACLENYLIGQRLSMAQDDLHCLYIPQAFHAHNPTENHIDIESLEKYRQCFGYNPNQPRKPVVELLQRLMLVET